MTRATFNLIEFDEIDLARQIEFGSTHFAELPTEARQLGFVLVMCRIKCINIQYIVVNVCRFKTRRNSQGTSQGNAESPSIRGGMLTPSYF